jgi:diacylglycerol kinase (ATP)
VYEPPRRTWFAKFRDAFRGLATGMRDQSSFFVHVAAAVLVAIAAAVLRVSLLEACVLALCVAAVLAAELFNTAIERLAREIDRQHNANIGAALDIASAAVLVAAIGSAGVGAAIFVYRLGVMMAWWAKS